MLAQVAAEVLLLLVVQEAQAHQEMAEMEQHLPLLVHQ
jgi:hypothetical protein